MFITSKILRNLSYLKFRNKLTVLNSSVYLQKSRNFHTNSKVCIKMFMEHENNYAYSVMKNKGYAINLNIKKDNTSISSEQFDQLLKEELTKKTHIQLFEIFPMLGAYCSEHSLCISNKIFDDFIDNLTDNIKLASDEELKSIFHSLMSFPETESVNTRNYIEVWAALDDECLNRIKVWSFDQMLSYVAMFYMLNATRVSDFSKKCLQKLASKAKQLTPGQLVQTIFFIGVLRRPPIDMHSLEIHLENSFEEFTVDELAIMSMGFFKSKTPIRSMELVKKIVNKMIANSEDIHEVSLAALLKVIRYSMKFTTDDKIYRLLDTLQNEVPRLSVMCNVHMALLGTATLTLHKDCLTKIADAVMKCMSQTRMKDLERLVLTYGTFSFIPPTKECFFQKVMDELRSHRREQEIEKFGKSFTCCIGYLGLLGIYPVDLMTKALTPEFITKTYGTQCYLYGREVLTLHNTSQIFCQEAKINHLSEKEAKILAKKYTDYVPSEDYTKQYNASERMVLDIYKVLKDDRGGRDYVVGDHILTHHQRGDIIVCNSHDGIPLPVRKSFDISSFGVLRRPPDDNRWIVFVIAGRNAIIYNSDTPTGHCQVKIKELRALGFHATLVPWTVYTRLKTQEEKNIYLNNLIKEIVK